MDYLISKDGVEINRIVADEEFCKRYYSKDGYSYSEIVPEFQPFEPPLSESELIKNGMDGV